MVWLDMELYTGQACSTILMSMVHGTDFLGVAVMFYNDVLDTTATVTIITRVN